MLVELVDFADEPSVVVVDTVASVQRAPLVFVAVVYVPLVASRGAVIDLEVLELVLPEQLLVFELVVELIVVGNVAVRMLNFVKKSRDRQLDFLLITNIHRAYLD
jgi:hypothetical protein